jgi:hypothetical protein
VVYAAAPADITRVIVGGRELVREGVHAEIDVAAELHASLTAVTEVRA